MQLYRGWLVVFAGAGVNLAMGIGYSWSVIADRLVGELGWTRNQGALPYTLMLLVFALMMTFTGKLQDRIGPRPVMMVGGIVAGLGFIGSALTLSPTGTALFFGLLFGSGLACCFSTATPAAVKWFAPEKRGTITGIVVSANGAGAAVLAPLVFFLLETRGLYNGFLITGLATIVFCTVLARFMANPPTVEPPSLLLKEAVTGETLEPAAPPETREFDWCRMVRLPQFYLLWLMYFLTVGTGLMLITHLTRIAAVHGGIEQGYVMVSLFAVFNATGRFVGGTVSDRLGRVRAMTLVFSLMVFTMLLLLFLQSSLLMVIAVICLGFTYGGLFAVFPAVSAHFFGMRNFGLNYGLIFTAVGMGGFLSPLYSGRVYEITGSFTGAFLAGLAATMMATLFTFFLRPPFHSSLKAKEERTGGCLSAKRE